MHWYTGLILYAMIWLVVLFTVLPFGVRPTDDPAAGHEPGAPEKPMVIRKLLITTAISVVLWIVAYIVIQQGWISFRESVQPFTKPTQ